MWTANHKVTLQWHVCGKMKQLHQKDKKCIRDTFSLVLHIMEYMMRTIATVNIITCFYKHSNVMRPYSLGL